MELAAGKTLWTLSPLISSLVSVGMRIPPQPGCVWESALLSCVQGIRTPLVTNRSTSLQAGLINYADLLT